ncbi:hypothetical protein [Mesorhizobium sp.]|uniref:hypothetical protein n=1 Tax=Mesorhizobium sp. TaxID=1871066 RepID=UPI003BA911EB
MQPDAELQRLIDECYAAFSDYPRPRTLHASPLRDPAEILKTLTSAPLRQLTGEQIGPYAGYALTTVGDVFDYKHFLPRILEEAVHEPFWVGTNPPVIAGKLRRAEWLQWPAHEQAAIRALFTGACAQAVEEHPDDADCANWICAMAMLALDLTAIMEAWLIASSANATVQLAYFVSSTSGFLFATDVFESAYWGNLDEDQIYWMRQWVLSEPVYRVLLTTQRQLNPSRDENVDKALEFLASLKSPRLH